LSIIYYNILSEAPPHLPHHQNRNCFFKLKIDAPLNLMPGAIASSRPPPKYATARATTIFYIIDSILGPRSLCEC